MLLPLIGAVWAFGLVLVVALCHGARLGDREQPGALADGDPNTSSGIAARQQPRRAPVGGGAARIPARADGVAPAAGRELAA